MSQTALDAILEMKSSGEITDRDLDVLLALTSTLDFENLIQLCQVDVAKKLRMKRQHVHHSIKTLCAQNLIIRGPKIGRSRTYQLNPHVGWKGSGNNHKKHLKLVSSATEPGP